MKCENSASELKYRYRGLKVVCVFAGFSGLPNLVPSGSLNSHFWTLRKPPERHVKGGVKSNLWKGNSSAHKILLHTSSSIYCIPGSSYYALEYQVFHIILKLVQSRNRVMNVFHFKVFDVVQLLSTTNLKNGWVGGSFHFNITDLVKDVLSYRVFAIKL